jgi:hypothetical protein
MANPDPNPGTVHMAVERREKDAGGAPSNKTAPKPANKELPPLSGMTKADLEKQAKKEGVDLSEAANNDDRRALIEKARK